MLQTTLNQNPDHLKIRDLLKCLKHQYVVDMCLVLEILLYTSFMAPTSPLVQM